MKRIQRPWLVSDVVFRFSKYGKKQQKCLKVLHDFTNKVNFIVDINVCNYLLLEKASKFKKQ